MAHVDPALPSHKTYQTIFDRPRRDASILMQLRCGHVALNMFLWKIRACDSALCSHCVSPESVSHFLLHCRRYTSQRRKMRYKVGVAATSVPRLLSDAEVIPHTLRYIAETARFEKYLDVGSNSQVPLILACHCFAACATDIPCFRCAEAHSLRH